MRIFAVVLMALVVMLAVAPPPAGAEYEVIKPGALFGAFFDPNWSGTKLSGSLSILYEFVAELGGGCTGVQVNMVFVLKLKKGNQDFVFGDRRETTPPPPPGGGPICAEDNLGQVATLVDFFLTAVMPQLFPNVANPADSTRLKSLSNFTQSDIPIPPPVAGETLRVSSMDIVLAVRE